MNTGLSYAEEAQWCRERAEVERQAAAASTLPNVKNRALRAVEQWEAMARRAERAQAHAANRSHR